ncbi:MAG TPA: DUF4345 domain-containing protein [Chitinophagales bacterium]|nr:DUF4345 domain-containing protein [Chitinophagales bacterium]
MKKTKFFLFAAKGFILLSALSFLSVSIMAWASPQAVMDLVNVQLGNTDALSSIRGVYGGVGLSLFIVLVYLMLRQPVNGLRLLGLLWGFYALSRITTLLHDGALGDFGTRWLTIETVFFILTVMLLAFMPKVPDSITR